MALTLGSICPNLTLGSVLLRTLLVVCFCLTAALLFQKAVRPGNLHDGSIGADVRAVRDSPGVLRHER